MKREGQSPGGAESAAKTAGRFADLETRGFVVIRGFLSDSEVQSLREDFEAQPIHAGNQNYQVTPASKAANAWLRERVVEVLDQVRTETRIKADLPQGGSYFPTGVAQGIKFDWHQDHESFFVLQNHYDYLNFYIPVVKPRRDKSNLSLVPFDVLQRESPRAFRKAVRGGATRFFHVGRRTVALCDDTGTAYVIPKTLDHLADTPMLAAGDLLLLRGDIIHRTQDADTARVALSYRVTSRSVVVSQRRLALGGARKAEMMANNPALYQRLFAAFDEAGRGELSLDEINRALASVSTIEPKSGREFFRQLLREKRKARVLGRYVASVVLMKGVTLLQRRGEG